MFDCETRHWWYTGLRAILLQTIRKIGLSGASRILDAGCGTGGNLREIQALAPASCGIDLSSHASRYWRQRGVERACRASINELPFRNECFDLALCVDVLECREVDEIRAYRELWRVTRRGGHLLVVVPAYPWLIEEKHHRAVHASRRYSRPRLEWLLRSAPVRILRVTHLFMTVFPAVTAYRLYNRFLAPPDPRPRSDVRMSAPLVNRLLRGIVDVERRWLDRGDLPFGSSFLAVLRK
jgi:SAM-dependent methyltransferase